MKRQILGTLIVAVLLVAAMALAQTPVKKEDKKPAGNSWINILLDRALSRKDALEKIDYQKKAELTENTNKLEDEARKVNKKKAIVRIKIDTVLVPVSADSLDLYEGMTDASGKLIVDPADFFPPCPPLTPETISKGNLRTKKAKAW